MPVLPGKEGSVTCGWQHWGFPGLEEKKLIYNARCESTLEKPMFQDSILHRRIDLLSVRKQMGDQFPIKNIWARFGLFGVCIAGTGMDDDAEKWKKEKPSPHI